MWFKQVQIFQLHESTDYSPEKIAEKLEALAFTPCMPSFPSSIGWVSPFEDENAPLVHSVNGYVMICLQVQEKILPASVIRQELNEKVKKREAAEERKIRMKEKLSLKDEVVMTLLPRAFSKMTRVYAYFDPKNHWLVLGTTHTSKTEQFMSLFKKSVTEAIQPFELKKLSPIITHWLKSPNYSSPFSIEKSCVLQDPEQQRRIIRCQQQDLFANSIQALLKDGCEVKQLALAWQDRVNFMLADDFSLRSLQYQEEILSQAKEIDAETKEQQFDADFFIMTETLGALIKELAEQFVGEVKVVKEGLVTA